MIGGDLWAIKHRHNSLVGYPDQPEKTNKLFTWPWEMKGWPLGNDMWKPQQKP